MIDPGTRDFLNLVQRRALNDGVNLFDALDRQGLILTDDRRKEVWGQCLQEAVEQVQAQQVTTFVVLGGGQNTPADTARGICEFLDFFMKKVTGEKG